MNPKRKFVLCLAAFAALIGLGGCAGMSRQDQNTLAGAGLGGVAGAALTHGSVGGTLGGAAAGGIIGRVLTPSDNAIGNRQYRNRGYGYDQRYDNRNRWNNGYGYGNDRRYDNGNRYNSAGNDWYGN